MTEEKSANVWKTLPFDLKENYAAPIALDEMNIIIASTEKTFQFNTTKCKFSVLFEYPNQCIFSDHSMALCGNKIYIEDFLTYNTILSYNMVNKSVTTSITCHGLNGILCSLNHKLHLVSGSGHQTFDNETNKWSKIHHKFQWNCITGHGLLALQSKKQLILLGGSTSLIFGGYSDKIWICHTLPKIRWVQLGVKLPYKMYFFGSVLFKNDKYLCIFGGYTKYGYSDEIWILDLTSLKWSKSNVKCPKKAYYYTVRLNERIYLFEINKPNCWVCKVQTLFPFNMNNNENDIQKNDNNSAKPVISPPSMAMQQTLINTLQIDLENEKKTIILLKKQNQQLLQYQYRSEQKIDQQQSELSALRVENMDLKMKLEQSQQNDKKNYGDLRKLNDEYKEMSIKIIKYNKLFKKEQYGIINNTKNYKNWNYNNISIWICNLDNKKFQKYEKELRIKLKEEGITGQDFGDLDKNDLHRIGITNFGDKKALLKHIQDMIHQNDGHNEEGN